VTNIIAGLIFGDSEVVLFEKDDFVVIGRVMSHQIGTRVQLSSIHQVKSGSIQSMIVERGRKREGGDRKGERESP